MATAVAGCGPDRRADSRHEGVSDRENPASQGSYIQLVDASGSVLTLKEPPSRIVSLVPSVTRTLLALGAQELLVGRTDYDTLASLDHLPSVGGGLRPSLEALVGLKPDLVIFFHGESDPETPDRLSDLGVPTFGVRLDRIADVRQMILDLGLIAGRGPGAASFALALDGTLAEIRRRIRGREPVKVAYVLGDSPPWVAGPDTYIHELMLAAGGQNVFADLDALYGPVSPEEFLVRDIDILLTPEGGTVVLPVQDLRIEEVSVGLELPGPDLADAAWGLAQLFHPEAFR
jgi:iron complex transport system substrate-binding protein